MIGIIITGLPASGKTYYSDWLIKILYSKGSVYHIFGDAIAHSSYNCQYTDSELDIKYNVMNYQIVQAKEKNYSYVVIDDLFKREKDFSRIASLFECLIVFRLNAELSVLMERNEKRPKYHRLSTEKMKSYYCNYLDVLSSKDVDVEINVSLSTRSEIKKLILRNINELELKSGEKRL